MELPTSIEIDTIEQAREMLSKYTEDDIRQLIENGAFTPPVPEAVKSYLVNRIMGTE